MNIISSKDDLSRNLAILLWGPAGSRKTETPLRYFPYPLVIDTEGKAHHAIGVDGVQEFLLAQTKDVYEILDVLEQLAAGEIKFPDGNPVQTVAIDSASVLWAVRQEAGSLMAERRAKRYKGNVNPDDVTMTMLDWTKVKRPLKRLMTKLNNSPVKYFFIISREKPLYEEVQQGGKKELKRVGETPDLQRGIDYEVDVAFRYLPGDPWMCEVTRTRGLLQQIMPSGTQFSEFPYETLLDYATGTGLVQQDEIEVAASQAEKDRTKTKHDLVEYGKEKGLTAKDIADALKGAKMDFNEEQWDEMKEVVDDFVQENDDGDGDADGADDSPVSTE